MNFVTDRDCAVRWLAAHPQVTGVLLDQERALRRGEAIFGHLLSG